MLSCQDLAHRADRYLERDLPLRERFQVRLHMFLCKHCSRYMEQLRLTIAAMRRSAPPGPSPSQQDQVIDRLLQAVRASSPAAGGGVPEVVIYTTRWCPYCRHAKALLRRKQVPYREIDVGRGPVRRQEMAALAAGRRSVPQIFIGGHGIGGCDDLYALEAEGQLDQLLGRAHATTSARRARRRSFFRRNL